MGGIAALSISTVTSEIFLACMVSVWSRSLTAIDIAVMRLQREEEAHFLKAGEELQDSFLK